MAHTRWATHGGEPLKMPTLISTTNSASLLSTTALSALEPSGGLTPKACPSVQKPTQKCWPIWLRFPERFRSGFRRTCRPLVEAWGRFKQSGTIVLHATAPRWLSDSVRGNLPRQRSTCACAIYASSCVFGGRRCWPIDASIPPQFLKTVQPQSSSRNTEAEQTNEVVPRLPC